MPIRKLLLATLLLCLSANAGAEAPATGGETLKVGAPITEKKAVDVDRLAKNPKRYVGRTVRIEGVVKDVCQGMGCWVEVSSAKGGSFLAKSLDESVLLPKDCKGQKVVVQGVVTSMPAKGAEAHQHAEAPAEGHACPAPTYLISTQGVELSKAGKS